MAVITVFNGATHYGNPTGSTNLQQEQMASVTFASGRPVLYSKVAAVINGQSTVKAICKPVTVAAGELQVKKQFVGDASVDGRSVEIYGSSSTVNTTYVVPPTVIEIRSRGTFTVPVVPQERQPYWS